MIDCKDNPIMADSRDDIAGLEPVCAAVAMPGGVEGAGDGQCNELSAADMCDEETLASAGSASATEICSHPCALEMIDCIDSQNEVIVENRHIIEMLQATCGSKQAECIPIIADLQGYFDETCCQGMDCSEGPPQTCSTGCGAYKQLFLRMLQDFRLNVGVSLQRPCFCRSGRTAAIRSTRWVRAAARFTAFAQRFTSALARAGAASPDFAEVATQMDGFNQICASSHPRKGGGGH